VCFQNDPVMKIRVGSSTLFGDGAAARAIDDALTAHGVTSVCLERVITCANMPVRAPWRRGFPADGVFNPRGRDETVPLLVHDLPATTLGSNASSASCFLAIRPEVEKSTQVPVPSLGDEAPGETMLSQIRRQAKLLSQGITFHPGGRQRWLPKSPSHRS